MGKSRWGQSVLTCIDDEKQTDVLNWDHSFTLSISVYKTDSQFVNECYTLGTTQKETLFLSFSENFSLFYTISSHTQLCALERHIELLNLGRDIVFTSNKHGRSSSRDQTLTHTHTRPGLISVPFYYENNSKNVCVCAWIVVLHLRLHQNSHPFVLPPLSSPLYWTLASPSRYISQFNNLLRIFP